MRRLLYYRYRRTTVLLFGYIGVLCGIGFAASGYYIETSWALVAGLATLLLFRKQNAATLVAVMLFCSMLGMLRGAVYQHKLAQYDAVYDHKVTLTARALTDGTYGKYSQFGVDAGNIVLANGQHLAGKIQVSGYGVNMIFQGDELVVTGKLRSGFGAYQGRVGYAQMQVVGHHNSLVAEFRRRFSAAAQTALPEPAAPFAMGILVGQRATLPDQVKDDFLKVGLTHIIAVSGYNLTIILNASRKLLGKRSKRISTLLSIALIGVFLLITGLSASIVRAAIVSMLSILTGYYGRTMKPLNLITLAAVITAWANPFYLWSDISWYLSFLAFFGVMIVAPLLHARTPRRIRDNVLVLVAIESICAEIMSLPYILHNFGQMSRVGLLANVLVVTLVPLAMLLSLFAGLAGMFVPAIAGWVAIPAKVLLVYMLDTAHILAGLPNIFVEGIGLSLWQMLFIYGLIAVMIWLLTRKTNDSGYDTITEKKLASTRGVSFERT